MSNNEDIEKRNVGGQPGNKNAEKWTEEKALVLGKELIEWMMPKNVKIKDKSGNEIGERDMHLSNIFWQDFICLHKGLNKNTMNYLRDNFESFSDLYDQALNIQEVKLLKYAVLNKLNSSITKFVLQNHHDGYSTKISHDFQKELPFSLKIERRKPQTNE